MTMAVGGGIADDEAEFQAWLASPASAVCHLVEMEWGPRSGFMSPGTTTEVLLSDVPFHGAVPAVVSLPSLRREISGTRVAASVGTLVLDNTLGVVPFQGGLFRKNIDGRKVRIYHGDPSWSRARFRRIFSGVASRVTSNTRTEIVIQLACHDALSNQEIQGSTITVGPNANRPKPLAYGELFNITPVLKDAAGSIYQWHDGASQEVLAVRDAGLDFQTAVATIASVDAGTDTITWGAAHSFVEHTRLRFTGTPPAPLAAGTDYWVIAAGLTAADCRVSATRGGAAINLTGTTAGATAIGYYWTADLATSRLLLATTPAGQLTMDVKGHVGADGYIDDLCSIAETIIGGGMVDARRREALRAALDAGEVQRHGLYIAERRNKLDVLDGLFGGVGAWYGYDRNGWRIYGRLFEETPDVWHVDQAALVGQINAGGFEIPRRAHRVLYAKNWTQQTSGLSAGVTDEDKATFGNAGMVAESTPSYGSGNPYLAFPSYPAGFDAMAVDHSLAYVPETIESTLANQGAAEWVAYYLNAAMAVWQVPVTFELGRGGMQMELGDVIYLTTDFVGVGGRGYARGTITSLEDRPSDGRVTVGVLFLVPHDNG